MTELSESIDVKDVIHPSTNEGAAGEDIDVFLTECLEQSVTEVLGEERVNATLESWNLSNELSADKLDSQTYFNLRMWEDQTDSGEAFAAFVEEADQQLNLIKDNTERFEQARRDDVTEVTRTKMETDGGLRKLRNPEVIEKYKEPSFITIFLSILAVAAFLVALLSAFSLPTMIAQGGDWLLTAVRAVLCVLGGLLCCVPRFIYSHKKKQWDTWHLSDQARRKLMTEHVREIAAETADGIPGAFSWGTAVWNDPETGAVKEETSLNTYVQSLLIFAQHAPSELPKPQDLPKLATIRIASRTEFPKTVPTMKETLAELKSE